MGRDGVLHSELLGFWTLYIVRHSKHYRTQHFETYPVSEMLFLEFLTMDKVQKPSNSKKIVTNPRLYLPVHKVLINMQGK
jgi:hypothetical protein